MTRIAFFGPLPPLKTGIADYNAALLPLLREEYEIDVFLPDARSSVEGFHHGDFFLKHKANPYDLTIYQMGNQPHFHEYMYGYLFQNPGAVVFHDYCLHHSRADMLLKRNMHEEYREELKYVYPDQADRIANAAVTFAAGDLLFFRYPLFELVLRASLAAAAHTEAGVKTLSSGGNTPVLFQIPFVQLPAGARPNPNILPGKTVIASFGFATYSKRISTVVEAFATVVRQHPNLHYAIVGALEDPIALEAQIKRSGLEQAITITGHVEIEEFMDWMARADIIVNLRYPSAGEMSATLVQAMATGKPVIISRLLNLQEIPDDAVIRIPPDSETEALIKALQTLLRDPQLRERLSLNAQKYVQTHHSPEKVKDGYRRLIETALQRKASFAHPDLPLHLQSGDEIIRAQLLRTGFARIDSTILDRIL